MRLPLLRSRHRSSAKSVANIQAHFASLRDISDHALAREFQNLSSGHNKPVDIDDARGLAIAAEAVRRVTDMAAFDCQLEAAMRLQAGAAVEMATGEGKTLAVAIASIMLAKRFTSVHVMTVNDYLAERDYRALSPVFELLGLTCSINNATLSKDGKSAAYRADVCYGVASEFGFDFLRDQLHLIKQPKNSLGHDVLQRLNGLEGELSPTIQSQLQCAVVDEIDSALVDEASSALILSDGERKPCLKPLPYILADHVAQALVEGLDYDLDVERKTFQLRPHAIRKIGQKVPPAGTTLLRAWQSYVKTALYCQKFLLRDKHYLVDENSICIVDESTGRRQPERNWSNGLHQAVEAKENVEITTETRAALSIARQNYFSRYEHLCGVSGTVEEVSTEIKRVYRLNRYRIPSRKARRCEEFSDRLFVDQQSKNAAIAEFTESLVAIGRPVLVGSRTIENSEALALHFDQRGIQYRLLSAKQDADEAAIISSAGQARTVTIATNMAGRGADIPLSTNVAELGGLFVIGAERHHSKRLDRQLAGRAARQGDPGSVRFFVSLEDELFANIGANKRAALLRMADDQGEIKRPIESEVRAYQVRMERTLETKRMRAMEQDQQFRHLARRVSKG